MIFKPQHNSLGLVGFDQSLVANHPMVFAAAPAFARREGGPLMGLFLDAMVSTMPKCLKHAFSYNAKVLIDSRCTMLKPGWYPSIPGWHLDDIPRDSETGHPDPFYPEYRTEHVIACFDAGTGSLTELLTEPINVSDARVWNRVSQGQSVWGTIDTSIENDIGLTRTRTARNGELVHITSTDFHRATPATGSGWRLFIRASFFSKRPVKNEIRRQTNVYLTDPSAGW